MAAAFPLSQPLPDAAAVAKAIGENKSYADGWTRTAVTAFPGFAAAIYQASASFKAEAYAKLKPEEFALMDSLFAQTPASAVSAGQAKLADALAKNPKLKASLEAQVGAAPCAASSKPWIVGGLLALAAAGGYFWWRKRSRGLGSAEEHDWDWQESGYDWTMTREHQAWARDVLRRAEKGASVPTWAIKASVATLVDSDTTEYEKAWAKQFAKNVSP